MSKFFLYFKNTLRFPYLFHINPISSFVCGCALVLDELRDTVSWIRDQFLVSKCGQDYIRHYAKSRGITKYPFETDEQYRDRIINAYIFFSKAGKESGIKEILKLYGQNVSIFNMRDEDSEKWAEFRCLFPELQGNLISKTEDFIAVINDIKPARSKLSGIRYSVKVDVPVRLGAVAKSKTRYIVQPVVEV